MQPTTPRLSNDPTAQPGYAPIAWAAVAALALAVGFSVVLVYLFLASFFKGLPLTDTWIPFVPAVVLVLAFVARRQIRASEGTRTGEVYANVAWWIAVVGLVAYVANVQGNQYTVQKDARDQFNEMAKNLTELDAFNPKDPNLTEACWLMLPPGARPASKKDTVRIEQAFGDALNMFRSVDFVRLSQRNHGPHLSLAAHGLKDWTVKSNEIDCTLSATLRCLEGDYGLELPMRATVDEKGVRRWQLKPAGSEGYIRSRNLTRAGWEALALEFDGTKFGQEMMARMSQPGQSPLLYLGYVHPGWQPNQAVQSLNQFSYAADPLAAATGSMSLPAVRAELQPRDRQPLPAGWYETLSGTVFGKPGGEPHAAADVERMWRLWSTAGMVTPVGSYLKGNKETSPVLAINASTVEFRMPVELSTGVGGPVPSAFKGQLVFRLPPDVAAPIAAARAAANPSDPKTTQPPDELTVERRPWRLVRFETDFKAVQGEAPRRASAGP